MSEQFEFEGKWVPKEHFRTFMYQGDKKKLANSYDEYMKMLEQGWTCEPVGSNQVVVELKSQEQVRRKRARNGSDR